MKSRNILDSRALKRVFGIQQAASIRFSDTKPSNSVRYSDTACTALGRVLKYGRSTFIDRSLGQLCPGANYFLGIHRLPKGEIMNVYVAQEKVFESFKACKSFLGALPEYPSLGKTRYITITPLFLETGCPDVVVLCVNPAQTSRLLGLSVFKKMMLPEIFPAGPSCLSLYAPLSTGRIHVNFIDYYDRYHQGKQGKTYLWEEHELMVAMPYQLFRSVMDSVPASPHGQNKPRLRPKMVDPFVCQVRK